MGIRKIKKILATFGIVFLLGMISFQVMGDRQLRAYAPDAQTTAVVVPVGPNFPVARNTGRDAVKGKPGIAFDGTNFLVPYLQGTDIYARRVTPGGVVLDSTPIAVSVGLNQFASVPSVAFDGTNYLVVWTATRNGVNELYGARLTPTGTVLDPGGVKITIGGDPKIRVPGIAFNGANYLVAWRTNYDHIYAARISPSLANLDAPGGFPIATVGTSYYPSVASDGINYLVVWHDGRNSFGGWSIYGARVTPQGSVLDPNGFVICDEPMNQEHSSVGFDGTNYLVAWYDWRPNDDQGFGSIYGARVSPAGVVLDTPAFRIADRAGGQVHPSVACGGTDCLVIWMAGHPDVGTKFRLSDVWGRRISRSGTIIDQQGIPVATSFGHQFGPIAGYGGGRYLVVWSESTGRELEGAVYGQILEQQVAPSRSVTQSNPQISVYNSDDNNWTVENAPISSYALAGLAFSRGNSYAFGYKQALHYQNGAWLTEEIFDEGYVYGSWADGPNNIWVTGWCRGFNHYDGQTWHDKGCFTSHNTWDIATAIWGSSPTHLWATADRGDLLRYDGIHNWETIDTSIPFDLSDLWGTSADNIYAVGERGTILHYDGRDWNQLPGIPTFQRLNAIWGSGPNDIFVVGDWGTILHFDGTAWNAMESGTTQHLYDVWGLTHSEVYAVGSNGTIIRYNGTAWIQENSGTTMDLLSVWGVLSECRLIVWASGSGQHILKREAPINCVFLPFVRR